jgi:hypothetical protein
VKRELGEIWIRDNEKYIKTDDGIKSYYRYLVEQYLGFPIHPGYIVHHINGNHNDNRLENFLILPKSLHFYVHRCGALSLFSSNLEIMKQKWKPK